MADGGGGGWTAIACSIVRFLFYLSVDEISRYHNCLFTFSPAVSECVEKGESSFLCFVPLSICTPERSLCCHNRSQFGAAHYGQCICEYVEGIVVCIFHCFLAGNVSILLFILLKIAKKNSMKLKMMIQQKKLFPTLSKLSGVIVVCIIV